MSVDPPPIVEDPRPPTSVTDPPVVEGPPVLEGPPGRDGTVGSTTGPGPAPEDPPDWPTTVTKTPGSVVREAVLSTLDEYQRAAEALDFDGVRRVWPTAPTALQTSYRNLQSQAIDLDCREWAVTGPDTLLVRCSERISAASVSSIALPVVTNTAVFSMRRAGNAWVIENISRQSR